MIPTFIAYYTGFHRSLWKGQARDTGYMLVEDCGLWIVDGRWDGRVAVVISLMQKATYRVAVRL